MNDSDHLYILWTNADPGTAQHMVMMYAKNAIKKEWWERVTVIIWGATAKYAAEDWSIQEAIADAMECGVEFSACIRCADEYGVVGKLNELGIETIPWGPPLTELLKSGARLLTV